MLRFINFGTWTLIAEPVASVLAATIEIFPSNGELNYVYAK